MYPYRLVTVAIGEEKKLARALKWIKEAHMRRVG